MTGGLAGSVAVHRVGIAAVLVGVVTALSTGCGIGGKGPGAAEGLTGTAMVVQDVEGLGSQPIDKGRIFAVPADRMREVLPDDVPEEHLSEEELPYLRVPLSSEDVRAAGGAVGELDSRGRFALEVSPPGEHLVCLAVDTRLGEQTGGCNIVDLPATGVLEITTGEAALHVKVT
jgi:hypothetical protein